MHVNYFVTDWYGSFGAFPVQSWIFKLQMFFVFLTFHAVVLYLHYFTVYTTTGTGLSLIRLSELRSPRYTGRFVWHGLLAWSLLHKTRSEMRPCTLLFVSSSYPKPDFHRYTGRFVWHGLLAWSLLHKTRSEMRPCTLLFVSSSYPKPDSHRYTGRFVWHGLLAWSLLHKTRSEMRPCTLLFVSSSYPKPDFQCIFITRYDILGVVMPRCACASEVYGGVFVCVCVSVCMSVCLSVCLSICLSRLLQINEVQEFL